MLTQDIFSKQECEKNDDFKQEFTKQILVVKDEVESQALSVKRLGEMADEFCFDKLTRVS